MWVILVVAVALVAVRGWGSTVLRPGEGLIRLLAAWMLVTFAVLPVLWAWFTLVPRWSLRLAGRDLERQSRLLRWVVNTPYLERPKVFARFLLASNDQAAGRHEEAEAGFRLILRRTRQGMDLSPSFESMLRQQLAETLEALGRPAEAAAEREQAAATLADEEEDETTIGCRSRGQLLELEHRYSEAIEAYERALTLAPPDQTALRLDLLIRLVLSTLNAGRPSDALRWAEAAIEADRDGSFDPLARRLASVACGTMWQLDDAERHARIALDQSRSLEERAETLSILGECAMRRGDLDEAERLAREAVLSGTSKTAWIIISLIEWERDRIGSAIEALEKSRAISLGPSPAANRRVDAIIDELLALDHADLGHHDLARELIGRAEAELAEDPKLAVSLDASAALVHALAGERDQALARIDSADRGRRDFPQDPATQGAVLSRIGRAALAVDDTGRAEAFLREYLDLQPDPLYHPYAWYHLGGCRRRLGDGAGGRECDAKAASTRFGCRWERYARERLAAEGVTA